MRLRPIEIVNPGSLSHGGDGNCDKQEFCNFLEGDNQNGDKDKESLSGANDEKGEEEVATVVLSNCMPAEESPPPTVKEEMQMILLRLGFSQTVTQKLVEDQVIDDSSMPL